MHQNRDADPEVSRPWSDPSTLDNDRSPVLFQMIHVDRVAFPQLSFRNFPAISFRKHRLQFLVGIDQLRNELPFPFLPNFDLAGKGIDRNQMVRRRFDSAVDRGDSNSIGSEIVRE